MRVIAEGGRARGGRGVLEGGRGREGRTGGAVDGFGWAAKKVRVAARSVRQVIPRTSQSKWADVAVDNEEWENG